jgi:type IV pilus assembly protein PilA
MLSTMRCQTTRCERRGASLAAAAHAERGFTLLELMVVVVIVGVMAALATYGVRKYVRAAKQSEATAVLLQIRSAEETYREESFSYLGLATASSWHPVETPPQEAKYDWGASTTAGRTVFGPLGVRPDGPVMYAYTVVVGAAGATPAQVAMATRTLTFPAATDPYYVAMARADLDGDGQLTFAVTYSGSNEIWLDDTF